MLTSGLNPYSIGIWSATSAKWGVHKATVRLNPYSIGIWSATSVRRTMVRRGLSLNPYSIGIWSATALKSALNYHILDVLILILLEYGLRQL